MEGVTDKIQRLSSQMDDKLSAIENAIVALCDSRLTVPPEVLELERSIAEKERRLSELEGVLNGSQYARGAWAVLGQDFRGLIGCVALLLKCSDEDRAAVERALGSSLFGLVFKTADDAKRVVQWVRAEKKGRILCVLADQIPAEFQQGLRQAGSDARALSGLVSCSPELTSVKHFLLGRKYQVDGDIFEYGLIDGGGSVDSCESTPAPEQSFAEAVRLRESINLEGSRLRQMLIRLDPSGQSHSRYEETESLIRILQRERIQLQETLQSLKMAAGSTLPISPSPNLEPAPSQLPPAPPQLAIENQSPEKTIPPIVVEPPSALSSSPSVPEAAPPPAEYVPPPRPKYDSEKLSKFKVLVIEDDEECAALTRTVLERTGLNVEWADGGPAATMKMENESFDLIVLDLMLPVQSGWQVYSGLKANPKTKNIPVIILSAITPSPGTFNVDMLCQKPLDDSFVKKVVSTLIPPPPRFTYPSR